MSVFTGATPVRSTWWFGDASVPADAPAPIDHAFPAPGDYPVRLVVVDSNGISGISEAITVHVTPSGPVPDFDGDGDVDQDDFGHLQICLSGTGVSQTTPACQDALLDGDADVDAGDLDILLGCMSGADRPADAACTTASP